MNVPADLAEKILQAGLRNVASDVGDGSLLNAQQRDLLMMFAMNPEIARRLRAYELVKRHCHCGELSLAQWAEVHAVYPEFGPGAQPPAEPPEIAQVFALSPEPARKRLTTAYLTELGQRYGRTPRQMRRYIDEGAPVEDATAFAAWWESERNAGRKTWSVPDGIALAAEKARAVAATHPVIATAMDARPSTDPPPPPPDTNGANKSARPINLEDYADAKEGDRLRRLKRLLDARWDELTERLKEGIDGTGQERAVIKLEDMISRIETRIEDRLKKRGLFLPVDSVRRDIAKVLDLMKKMSESEARRVLELCPGLSGEMKTQVAAAIVRVGQVRRRILSNIKSLHTPDDAVRELAAA